LQIMRKFAPWLGQQKKLIGVWTFITWNTKSFITSWALHAYSPSSILCNPISECTINRPTK
jgi:hypothetical protein